MVEMDWMDTDLSIFSSNDNDPDDTEVFRWNISRAAFTQHISLISNKKSIVL